MQDRSPLIPSAPAQARQRSGSLRRRAIAAVVGALMSAFVVVVFGEAGASADPADAGGRTDKEAGGGDAAAKIPPDPPAMTDRTQWVFDLRWERGEVYLVAVHKIDMGGPHPTPRMMGRFALELYEGPTLIERARFDFPMLGAVEAADAGWKSPARFEPKLKTRIGVIFPATKRGTRLELWDRSTDRRWPMPWPPKEGAYGEDDAGVRAPR